MKPSLTTWNRIYNFLCVNCYLPVITVLIGQSLTPSTCVCIGYEHTSENALSWERLQQVWRLQHNYFFVYYTLHPTCILLCKLVCILPYICPSYFYTATCFYILTQMVRQRCSVDVLLKWCGWSECRAFLYWCHCCHPVLGVPLGWRGVRWEWPCPGSIPRNKGIWRSSSKRVSSSNLLVYNSIPNSSVFNLCVLSPLHYSVSRFHSNVHSLLHLPSPFQCTVSPVHSNVLCILAVGWSGSLKISRQTWRKPREIWQKW